MRALLVDDERLARAVLRSELAAHPDVEIVAEADSVDAAVEILRQQPVDLIFLDVQMPGGSGLTLFDRLPVEAHVIFVTAWDRYAVRAFEVHALDYLLKPVSPERLGRALDRAREQRTAPAPEIPSDAPLAPDEIVCLPTATGMRFFRVREITHLTAAGDYVEVHLLSGPAVLSSTPLRTWEERLPDAFVRIHRSTVVNLDHVEGVSRSSGGYTVQLAGGVQVAMSRRHAARLQAELGRKLR